MSTNAWLVVISAMMVNAVLFGTGAVTVLAVPALAAQAPVLLPAAIAASFILAPLIALLIAPRMRFRNWGKDGWRRGDLISG